MTSQYPRTNASLSTMWAISNYPDLKDFFRASQHLGFQKVELNHQVNSKMLAGVNWDQCKVSSIHEPCPANITTKELVERDWLISSANEKSRSYGVEAVKKSIDLAYQLSAPVVVIHCGNVSPMIMNLERSLRLLFEQGEVKSSSYQEMKLEMIRLRDELVGPRLEAVKKSLQQLIDYATKLEIKLGLENRYHFMDIPSITEMGELLNLSDEKRLGFIYDVGHAQAMDRLGFYRHEDWLTLYSSRMVGCHLHDVSGLTDHLAPGRGEIDFKKIAPYLPASSFKTVEIMPGNTHAQVKHGIDHLIDAGCIKYYPELQEANNHL